MKKTKILYAVCGRSHTGTLIKPSYYRVLKSDKVMRRIVLAPSIEQAIYLTYPDCHLADWNMARIKAYAIIPENRHSIHEPKFLERAFGFEHAVEHEEYACFSNLRMQEVGIHKLLRNSLSNIDLVDELGSTYGKRFALF